MPKPTSKSAEREAPTTATADFKRFFARGLAALLPTLLTVALLIWAYDLIDRNLGRFITRGMVALFAAGGPPQLPGTLLDDALKYGEPIDEWDGKGRRLTVEYKVATHPILDQVGAAPEARKAAEKQRNVALWTVAFRRYKLHFLGFLIAIVVVYFVGLFLASLIGRATWRMIERLLYRIPIVKAIYPNIKQVTDFVLTERTLQFSGVVAIEYPRKGLWSMGLVTGPPMRTLQDAAQEELMTVFIPSSPTPITGYVITVRRSEVIDLGLSMDEAMRYSISAGVIKPQREELGPSQSAQADG